MKRTFKEQFNNPIVHMDREGNGYCRILEFWDSECYYTGEKEPAVFGEAPLPTTPYIKTGSWSGWERDQLKRYLDVGMDIQAIADRLYRPIKGVQRNIKYLKDREARDSRNNKKKKAA